MSDARKSAACAISSGLPFRLSAHICAIFSLSSSEIGSHSPVTTTRREELCSRGCAARSRPQARGSAQAARPSPPGRPCRVDIRAKHGPDPVITNTPPALGQHLRQGAARQHPRRLQTGVERQVPLLLAQLRRSAHRVSGGVAVDDIEASITFQLRSGPSPLRRQAWRRRLERNAPRPPALSIESTVSWPLEALMSATMTLAPCWAKRTAVALPIPDPPPVISATPFVQKHDFVLTPVNSGRNAHRAAKPAQNLLNSSARPGSAAGSARRGNRRRWLLPPLP